MTDVKSEGIFNLTQPVVMSFPQLFEAKAFKKNGKEAGEAKFSANFNFPADSPDLKELKQLAARLARAKWPDKPFFLTTQEGVKIPQVVFPFTSGDKIADDRAKKGKHDSDWMRGKVVVSSRSKYEPRLSYIENGRIVDLENEDAKIAAKGKFYPGVEVLAQFNLVPYDAVGNQGMAGVTAYLNMVVSTNKGTRLSGGQTASETFKGYVGAVSAEDPTSPGAGADMIDDF